ncbi:hypothetical protein MTO96_010498 [Rhipicephalus appendiculatus]
MCDGGKGRRGGIAAIRLRRSLWRPAAVVGRARWLDVVVASRKLPPLTSCNDAELGRPGLAVSAARRAGKHGERPRKETEQRPAVEIAKAVRRTEKWKDTEATLTHVGVAFARDEA